MNIRAWREQNSMSQEQLAAGVGMTRPHLSKLERGLTRPSPELAKRFEAFTKGEVTAAGLLGLNEPARGPGVSEDASAFVPETPTSERPWRKPVTVTVQLPLTDWELEDIRAYVPDLEAVAREAGLKAIRAAYKAAWGEAARDAIEANNRWIEEHGTFAEQMGLI